MTITNLKNEGDEHLVEFVANNVDRHNTSFHSLFYTLVGVRDGVRVSPNPDPDPNPDPNPDPDPDPNPNPNPNQALLAPPPSGRAPTAPTAS